jgi:hypothetical protein
MAMSNVVPERSLPTMKKGEEDEPGISALIGDTNSSCKTEIILKERLPH